MQAELKRLHEYAEHLEWQVRSGTLPAHRAATLLAENQTTDAAGTSWVLRRINDGFSLFAARPGSAWSPAHPSGFATLHRNGPQLAKWELRPAYAMVETARRRVPFGRLSLLLSVVVVAAAAVAASADAMPPHQVAIQAERPTVLGVSCSDQCGTPLAVTVIDLIDDRLATEKGDTWFCNRALRDGVILIAAEQLPGAVRCVVQTATKAPAG